MSNIPYRIIAYHADAPGLYLVSAQVVGNRGVAEPIGESDEAVGNFKVPEHVIEMAQVLDTRQGILFPPTPLLSLCEHDPWQRYEGDQSLIVDLLKQVTPFTDIQ